MTFLEKQIKRAITVTKTTTNDNTLAIAQLPKTKVKVLRVIDLGFKDGYYHKHIIYTKYSDISYNDLVNGMVREKYSESEEFAILRKAFTGVTEEFTSYHVYVEGCKAQAKIWINNRDKLLEV